MTNPTFREVCDGVGVTWLEVAEETSQPPGTMKKRYYHGHVPRIPEAKRIIRFLLVKNREAKAFHPSVIRNLWDSP